MRLGSLLLLAVLVPGLAACSEDPAAEELTVTWGESPACVSYPDVGKVGVTLEATGVGEATARVTAYADEDTTQPVGSGTVAVTEAGPTELIFEVSAPPYVDVDGVAACSIDVSP